MTATRIHLRIEQGATYFLPVTWMEGPVDNPPGPVSLTGAVLRMQIRKTQQGPVLIEATSTSNPPRITHNGAGGQIWVKLPAAATNLLTAKTCLYDLEALMPNGDVYRVIEGTVTVSPNVTQNPAEPVVV